MLGLAEQVHGDDEGLGLTVGYDEDLGRPGEQVDADLTEQLALRLRHVGVARAREQVDTGDRLRSQCHRRDRLDAPEDVDLVGPGHRDGGDRRGRNLSPDRRGACSNAAHAGDLGGDDRHMSRGDQRVPAAGKVRSGGGHRDVAVAEPNTGNVSISTSSIDSSAPRRSGRPAPGRNRCPRSPARARRDDAIDVVLRQPEADRRPRVESLRVLPHRRVAAVSHIADDLLDRVAHGLVTSVR